MLGDVRDPHLPDFIVIGAQKSASTFIQNALGAHPEIYTPGGETPYFETPDYEDADGPPWEALWGGHNERVRGIKRPQYIGKEEVPARVSRDLPDAKLIAVLRNPLDRIVAAYFHQIKYGTFPAVPLERGLRDVLQGGPLSQRFPRSRELVEFGLYGKHLQGYRSFSEKSRLLVLLHEDIIDDPKKAIAGCYRFLGVRDDFMPPGLNKRPQKVIYSVNRLKFLTLRNRFLHSYNADRTRLSVRKLNPVEWLVVAGITSIDLTLMKHIFKDNKPTLPADLRSDLVAAYRDDIMNLETMISRNLSHWLV